MINSGGQNEENITKDILWLVHFGNIITLFLE
jgi:hypothetical protein